jgi:hypothetical protein
MTNKIRVRIEPTTFFQSMKHGPKKNVSLRKIK